MAEIIDGKQIAAQIRAELKTELEKLEAIGIIPGLAVILAGDNPASISYVSGKEKACTEVGINSRQVKLDNNVTEEHLIKIIEDLNRDPAIDGILVQLPLPDHISEDRIISAIKPEKDVDGFTPVNIGNMILGRDTFIPCTPNGILKIFEYTGISTEGKNIVIMGRSNIVGKPLANLLCSRNKYGNATVTICHTKTQNLSAFTRQADIIIAAAGQPGVLKADMIKEGAVVIDVGVNRIPDSSRKSGYRIKGDTDFEGLKDKASFITPVPGGVGPLTITMLLYNTVTAAKRRRNNFE
jgi:methylenetetrahydrofolate dehydrogenase (NADP+)/methenyltetrahydrofolate cyclohydrolase